MGFWRRRQPKPQTGPVDTGRALMWPFPPINPRPLDEIMDTAGPIHGPPVTVETEAKLPWRPSRFVGTVRSTEPMTTTEKLLDCGGPLVVELHVGVGITTRATVLLPRIPARQADVVVDGERCPGVHSVRLVNGGPAGNEGEVNVRKVEALDWEALAGRTDVVIVFSDAEGVPIIEIPLKRARLGHPVWDDSGLHGTIPIEPIGRPAYSGYERGY